MKLKDSLFSIVAVRTLTDGIEYSIRLDARHPIYNDHFPNNPITPGVCIIETIKELVADHISASLFLYEITKVRYFKTINPIDNADIDISMTLADENSSCNVSATVFSGETVFAKLAMKFIRN
jgi:3-hydroxyacyl-[acyl-carrier-protein] dehydratase